MSLKLTTSLSQRLVLTPQLRQRIEMLQMTSLELTDLIQQQLLENPVLEEVPSQEEVQELAEKVLDHLASSDSDASFDQPVNDIDPVVPSSNGSGDTDVLSSLSPEGETYTAGEEGFGEEHGSDEPSRDAFEEIDFGREFQDYLDPGYKTQEIEYKEDAPTFEQFLTRPPSLAEHLEWQLNMSQAKSDVVDAAICVIGNLNADGRLTATNEEITAMGGWSEEVVEKARQALMRLDPVGCGARDVKECLLVQLEVLGESERLAAFGIGLLPLREGARHRIAQHQDDLDVRVVAHQPPDRRAPIERDGRRLAAHPIVFGVKRIERAVIRRLPIERLVVEEMRFLLARHLQGGMQPQQRIERGGARFLRTADDESEPVHAECVLRKAATIASTASWRTCWPSSRKTSPVIAYS